MKDALSFKQNIPLISAGMGAFIALRNKSPIPETIEQILSENDWYFEHRMNLRETRAAKLQNMKTNQKMNA